MCWVVKTAHGPGMCWVVKTVHSPGMCWVVKTAHGPRDVLGSKDSSWSRGVHNHQGPTIPLSTGPVQITSTVTYDMGQ